MSSKSQRNIGLENITPKLGIVIPNFQLVDCVNITLNIIDVAVKGVLLGTLEQSVENLQKLKPQLAGKIIPR